MKKITDVDLAFLETCTSAELDPLVDALLGKNHTGRLTSTLDTLPVYKINAPRHEMYVGEIVEDLRAFAGNTFVNMFRGEGVSYREMLCDVAKQLKVNFNKKQSIEMIESGVLGVVLEKVWASMSEEEKRALLEEIGEKGNCGVGAVSTATLQAMLKSGGFKSYKLVLIVVNKLWKILFGKGLSLTVNKSICKFLKVMSGPVGWAITGVWTLVDIASPAYRVTAPAVVYISALRVIKRAA